MLWILVALQFVDVAVTLYGINQGLLYEANPLIAGNMNLIYVKPLFAYLGGRILKRKMMLVSIVGSALIDFVGILSLAYMVLK